MQSFRIVLALGLAATVLPQAAQACAMRRSMDARDVREAELVVVGRLSGYRTVLDQEQRRRNREMLARHPALRDSLREEPKSLIGDYVVFDVAVEKALVGRAPRRIRVTWNNSTFGEPERMPDGRYLMALRQARPGASSAPDFTIFQYPCSTAFLFRSGSPQAVATLRALAGEEPYPPDPPAPRPPPEPATEASYRDTNSPPSLAERIPPPYRIVLGAAALGLLVAVGSLAWPRGRRRPDDEDAPPDA